MSLRVAWVGPYDVMSLARRMDQRFMRPFHAATWIRNGAQALAEQEDVELHVLTYDKRFVRDYRFAEGGVRFHFFRALIPQIPRPLVLYQLDRWRLQRELDEIQPDIVHGHGTENAFSYVAVTSGYPHVISMQAIISALYAQYRRPSRRALEHAVVRLIERYTVRRAQNVIIKAPFAEEFVRSLNPKASIFLVENIVHELFFDVVRNPGGAGSGRKILFVGTLIDTKGVEELILAFGKLAPRFHDIELHLVGTGTQRYVDRIVKPMIRDLGERVVLRGHLSSEEIASEFRGATMVVLPSYFDTSPNVIAEAMVAGVPVIGTDVGGIPFMIANNQTGQIVSPGDVPALAEAIERYLEDPDSAEKHAARARAEGRRRFDRRRYVESLLAVYRSVLGASAAHGRLSRGSASGCEAGRRGSPESSNRA